MDYLFSFNSRWFFSFDAGYHTVLNLSIYFTKGSNNPKPVDKESCYIYAIMGDAAKDQECWGEIMWLLLGNICIVELVVWVGCMFLKNYNFKLR